MNRKITFMALALLLGSAFVGSCSNNDEPDPVPEETLLIRNYTGFAVGNSQHFQNMLSTTSDTVSISPAKLNSSNFDIIFKSGFWGNAKFENVSFQKVDGVFQLADTKGLISMPQRRPGVEMVTYNDYPATLKGSTIHLSQHRISAYDFVIEANLGERAGVYTLELKSN